MFANIIVPDISSTVVIMCFFWRQPFQLRYFVNATNPATATNQLPHAALPPTLRRRAEAKKEGGSDDEQEEKEKIQLKEDDASGESNDSDNDAKKKHKDDLQDLVRKVRFNLESLD